MEQPHDCDRPDREPADQADRRYELLHNALCGAIAKVCDRLSADYNPNEHPNPETLVKRRYSDRDHNVEVIYYDDHVLLQENGDHGLGRATFVWTAHNRDWAGDVTRRLIKWFNIQ